MTEINKNMDRKNLTLAYLGPVGSFTHNVAMKAFPSAQLMPFETITDVIKTYQNGQSTHALVPIENTIEGSVHETLDYLFHQSDLKAVAEIVQPIKQQLMTNPGTDCIKKIFSHPQALAQSDRFLKTYYPNAKLEMTSSTAYGARYVAEHSDKPYAAIAPETAAETYQLQIIAADIQDLDENVTRFWVLGDREPEIALASQEKKWSLALTLPSNQPGALYQALSVFAWRGIDLTKIESRPLKTVLGEYFFILDIKYSDLKRFTYALEELASLGIETKVLGDYQVYTVR